MLPRLKSLELHGYKTFASRTLFEFPGVITAIVGPNGSGKSNIADSLRWVLGEQSYGLLRGRKTEDMIFSGSEQRSRAGMASAMITFDNSDGWLPIDFSEVSITRRAYRDGQNEYLLNGQRVRLREISELLAQSGLAERTYTIIGQGLVDAALALKPEERRRLFEEAAGIGLYRSRREEALNRLEATRRNLERVQDILAELEPRLQSLERQARRAQEYERIKADLRLLLRDWYGYHWHQIQKEIGHVKEVVRAQARQLAEARQRQQEVEQQLAAHRGRLQGLREKLTDWHAQSSRLHNQREKLSRDLAILEERLRSAGEQRQGLTSDITRLEEEIQTHQKRLEEAQAEQERLQANSLEAQAQAELAAQTLQSRQKERHGVENRLREARQALVSSETRLVQIKAHLNELTNRAENEKNSYASAVQVAAESEKELEKAREKLAASQAEQGRFEQEEKEALEALRLLREKAEVLSQERKRLFDQRTRQEGERARLNVQLDVLEQAENSMSGYAEGARFLFQAVRQGQLKGGYQTLSSQLQVPAEYEQAIAAALGDFLDAIVLDSQADPENAMVLLQKGEKGRAVLLPAAWMRPGERAPARADEGVLGLAADLIGCPEELQALVDLLLGNVLVVKDRQAARKQQAGLPANSSAVTLAGEVFFASGSVLAGKGRQPGTLSRPRQKKELGEAVAGVQDEIERLTRLLEEQDKKIEEVNGEVGSSDRAAKEAGKRASAGREATRQATLTHEKARRQVDWQVEQHANLKAQMDRTAGEIARVTADISGVEAQIGTRREQVHKLQAELAVLSLDEFQAQVTHWNTSAAFAARVAEEAASRLEERRQTLSRAQQQLSTIKRRLEDILEAGNGLEQDRSSLSQQEKEVIEKIEALRASISPAEEEMSSVQREFEELQAVEGASQQALTVAERHSTQAQLELTRQRDALDALRRRIEEDFGLVAFEYEAEVDGQTPLPLEGMVEQLPALDELPAEIEDSINRQRAQLRRMGAINPEAQKEYGSVLERYEFMTAQVSDLKGADVDLRQVIAELDELMKREFQKTFEAVAAEFKVMFHRLFGGGSAHLVLTDADTPTEAGIDIEARLPGRREQGLSLLSGGERSLTAVALVFSLLKVSPTSFCVLDEVDAMLDESNVGRFRDLLIELSGNTQFIVITHNRNTVQAADVIYGITMGRDSASQTISLKLDEVGEEMVR